VKDAEGFIFDWVSHVPDNLPEIMQYNDLLRDACLALGVPPPPIDVVQHEDELTQLKFEEDDTRMQRDAKLWTYPTSRELAKLAATASFLQDGAGAQALRERSTARKMIEEGEAPQRKKDAARKGQLTRKRTRLAQQKKHRTDEAEEIADGESDNQTNMLTTEDHQDATPSEEDGIDMSWEHEEILRVSDEEDHDGPDETMVIADGERDVNCEMA